MNKIRYILYFLLLFSLLYCQKKTINNITLEQARYNSNGLSYSAEKLDSIQAINRITRQKVREVLELSILYESGNKDTEIDEAVYRQTLGYFHKPDSTTLQHVLSEIDSLKAKNISLSNFRVEKRVFKKDTLNFALFDVEYFNKDNQSLGVYNREAQYILMPAEIRFKKEFKFYFLNFYDLSLKEKTWNGVIK